MVETSSSETVTMDMFKKLELSVDSKFEQIMALLQPKATTPNPESTPLDANASLILSGFVATTEKLKGVEDEGNGAPSPKDKNGPGDYSRTPPPHNYTPDIPIPMPHIVPQGPPPMLDASSFANWQFLMRSHVSRSSTELWRIIEDGFKPQDPKNLTRREVVDMQLNATALHMIQRALTPKDCLTFVHSPPPKMHGIISPTCSLGIKAFKMSNMKSSTMSAMGLLC